MVFFTFHNVTQIMWTRLFCCFFFHFKLLSKNKELLIYCFVECNAGYYGNGTSCTACTGVRIKSSQGDAPDCNTECDPAKSQPNPGHTECGMPLSNFSRIPFSYGRLKSILTADFK